MEHLDCSLSHAIRARRIGQLGTTFQPLHVLAQLANALAFIHAHRLIHCDITPGNCLLSFQPATYQHDASVANHSAFFTLRLATSVLQTIWQGMPAPFRFWGVAYNKQCQARSARK
jgi:hypothetical protein